MSSQKKSILRLSLTLVLALVILAPIGWRLSQWLQPAPTQQVYQQGLAALATGDLASTQLAAEALSAKGVEHHYRDVLEAGIDLRLGRVHGAAVRLQTAMQAQPTAAVAHAMTGEALYKNRQFGAAIDVLRVAVELDDRLVDAHRWLAAAYYDIGATGPTIKELARVSELDPQDPRPHRLTGLIYKDMESYDAAIAQYRQALSRSRDFPDRKMVLRELAECLLKAGKLDEIDEVLAQCPLDTYTLTFSAQSQYERGDLVKAAKLVEQALAMEARHLPALLLKATIQADQSHADEALESLKQAVEWYPVDNKAHYQLSQLYARRGDKTLAEQHATEAARLRDLRAHFTDLHAQASENLNNAEVRYQLGVTARQLGMKELAITWLSAALALKPDYAEASEELKALTQ